MDTIDQRTAVPRASLAWSDQVRATLVLGLPLAGTQLAQVAIHVTDTVMVGRLGTVELAAGVLATSFFHLLWMLGSGFAIAVMPMVAAAAGQDDTRAVRRSVRMGLWVSALYSVAVLPVLMNTRAIMQLLGQVPEVVELTGQYMDVLQWSMFPALCVIVFRSFLGAMRRANVVFAITLVGVAFNALVAYTFIYGHFGAPALGVAGAGLAGLLTMSLIATLGALYCAFHPALRHLEIFVRFWRPDWPGFMEIVRLGWPIGATIVAEVGLFWASGIMVGWIGPVPLAAHGIALQLASIAFMIPLGLANAATVRVGLAYGAKDAAGIGRAARAAMLVALTIAIFAAIVFWVAPAPLIGLYLSADDPNGAAVLAYAVPLLAVAAAFQLFDSTQAMAAGILRGLKDTRVPMMLAVISYWLVGMPAGYILAFPVGLGGIGVWLGLGLGLLLASVLLSRRFLNRERQGQLLFGA